MSKRRPSGPDRGRIAALACFVLLACRPHDPGVELTDEAADVAPPPASHDAAAPSTAAERAVRIVRPAAPESFVDLANELAPSIVSLHSSRRVLGGPADAFPGVDDERALGSGFLIDRNGYLLTADALVADAPRITARLADGRELAADVVGRDPKLGVALLRIAGSPALVPAALGSSSDARVGEWVLALGNPFGTGVSASAGVLAATADPSGASLVKPRTDYYHLYLQTDARIHAGNAGGPLVNAAGEVIGINTLVSERPAPLGSAVPIDRAKEILPALRDEGQVSRAWLGIYAQPVTAALAERLGVAAGTGALVADLIPGAPATKAGIRRGDVIIGFGGRDVTHESLPWEAGRAPIGVPVAISLMREGEPMTIELVTEKMPR